MKFNREYIKIKQYYLNSRDQWIASLYGDKLSYNDIVELRLLALKQVLIKYNADVITDIPFGKGFLEYREKWEIMMKETIKTRSDKK